MENAYKIKILTPTHIGSENEPLKEGFDYFTEKGKTHFINWTEIFKDDRLSYEVEKEIISGFLSDSLKSELIQSKLTTVKQNLSLKGDVREHITNRFTGNPIIPGSSIKGAIRSVLLNWLMEKTGEKQNAKEKFINKKQESSLQKKFFGVSSDGSDFMRFFQVSDVEFETEPDYIASKVLSLVSLNKGFISKWKHKRTNKDNKDEKFKKEGFTTNYQIIPLNSTSEQLKIKWNEKQFSNFIKDDKGKFLEKLKLEIVRKEKELEKIKTSYSPDRRKINEINREINDLKSLYKAYQSIKEFSISKLFQIINDYTIAFADKEIKFHTTYNQAEHSDKLISAWQNIKKLAQQAQEAGNNYAILRLGQGSGFHSITGDWQFDTHIITGIKEKDKKGKIINRGVINNKEAAKTRKWAFRMNGNNPEFFPMGFIAIGHVPEDLMFDSQISDKKSQPTNDPKPQPESQKPYEPTWKSLKNLKRGDIIDAVVEDFESPFLLCKVYVEEVKDKIFKVRFPAGKEKESILQLKINNIEGRGENKRLPEILTLYKVIHHAP